MNWRVIPLIVAVVCGVDALGADPIAAVVNGEQITTAELDAAMAAPRPGEKSAVDQRQVRLDVLQLLIDDKLIRQFLKQNGPKVESAEVEQQLAALESAQKSAGKTLEAYLKEAGLTRAQIAENFRQMLQLAKYLEAQATPERLQKYFESAREMFDGTTVRTSHLVIRTTPATSAEERKRAVEKLRSIRAEVLAGKIAFAVAAREHSQCPSGRSGGDLGFVVRKFQVDEAIARTAFSMQPNQLSDIVETEIGYHLVMVTDRKPGKAIKYEEVMADVRDCFEAELKQLLLADLRRKARIDVRLK